MHRSLTHAPIARLLCVLISCIIVACAPKKGAASHATGTIETERPVASGVEGMRWVVKDEPKEIDKALAALQADGSLHASTSDPFITLGFRAYTMQEAQLGALLTALGGTPALERVWFGQVTRWTDVASNAIAADRLISLHGRASAGEARLFRLEFRGWTFPTLDGSASAIEFRASVDSPTLSGLPTRTDASGAPRGTMLANRWRLELARNDALIVLADPALALTPDTGPEVAPLPTVADVLLRNPSFPTRREIFVFIPRFADTLPQPLVESSAPARESDSKP